MRKYTQPNLLAIIATFITGGQTFSVNFHFVKDRMTGVDTELVVTATVGLDTGGTVALCDCHLTWVSKNAGGTKFKGLIKKIKQ